MELAAGLPRFVSRCTHGSPHPELRRPPPAADGALGAMLLTSAKAPLSSGLAECESMVGEESFLPTAHQPYLSANPLPTHILAETIAAPLLPPEGAARHKLGSSRGRISRECLLSDARPIVGWHHWCRHYVN
jgi:hypothetical protein